MIPTKPPPTLKNFEEWSTLFQDFIAKCLIKNPEERTSAVELLTVQNNLNIFLNNEFFFSTILLFIQKVLKL